MDFRDASLGFINSFRFTLHNPFFMVPPKMVWNRKSSPRSSCFSRRTVTDFSWKLEGLILNYLVWNNWVLQLYASLLELVLTNTRCVKIYKICLTKPCRVLFWRKTLEVHICKAQHKLKRTSKEIFLIWETQWLHNKGCNSVKGPALHQSDPGISIGSRAGCTVSHWF